ncbi:MAG: ComF family protein [Clostridia bacterium]|nr:ComF family protein [Clostridia bacterium]
MHRLPYFFLFPRKCAHCGRVIEHNRFYCPDCREKMPFIEAARCEKCGCGRALCICRAKSTNYTALLAPFYYEGGAKHAVLRMKRYPIYAEVLAEECVRVYREYYGSIRFDAVCAVPMSRERLKRSGFNHSERLARRIAEQIAVPYQPLLRCVTSARPQHKRGLGFRTGNVRGIYDIIENTVLKDKTILLVDDIKTSGATLGECALMLRLGGAEEVYALCAAVAKPAQAQVQ